MRGKVRPDKHGKQGHMYEVSRACDQGVKEGKGWVKEDRCHHQELCKTFS